LFQLVYCLDLYIVILLLLLLLLFDCKWVIVPAAVVIKYGATTNAPNNKQKAHITHDNASVKAKQHTIPLTVINESLHRMSTIT
jgi:hypothetical protein